MSTDKSCPISNIENRNSFNYFSFENIKFAMNGICLPKFKIVNFVGNENRS